MEPIKETREAVSAVDLSGEAGELLLRFTRLGNRAQEIVPDLIGVSLDRRAAGLTFTLMASSAEVAILDAVQFLAGGPAMDAYEFAADRVEATEADQVERQWQLFAESTAAQGVRSTLTLPLISAGGVAGTVNLYAGTRRAFVGHHEELAALFGAWARGAITNADLSFETRREAEAAPARLRTRATVGRALGILAERLEVEFADANRLLRDASAHAGLSPLELAEEIVRREHPR